MCAAFPPPQYARKRGARSHLLVWRHSVDGGRQEGGQASGVRHGGGGCSETRDGGRGPFKAGNLVLLLGGCLGLHQLLAQLLIPMQMRAGSIPAQSDLSHHLYVVYHAWPCIGWLCKSQEVQTRSGLSRTNKPRNPPLTLLSLGLQQVLCLFPGSPSGALLLSSLCKHTRVQARRAQPRPDVGVQCLFFVYTGCGCTNTGCAWRLCYMNLPRFPSCTMLCMSQHSWFIGTSLKNPVLPQCPNKPHLLYPAYDPAPTAHRPVNVCCQSCQGMLGSQSLPFWSQGCICQ
jgi:hypothetical protein